MFQAPPSRSEARAGLFPIEIATAKVEGWPLRVTVTRTYEGPDTKRASVTVMKDISAYRVPPPDLGDFYPVQMNIFRTGTERAGEIAQNIAQSVAERLGPKDPLVRKLVVEAIRSLDLLTGLSERAKDILNRAETRLEDFEVLSDEQGKLENLDPNHQEEMKRVIRLLQERDGVTSQIVFQVVGPEGRYRLYRPQSHFIPIVDPDTAILGLRVEMAAHISDALSSNERNYNRPISEVLKDWSVSLIDGGNVSGKPEYRVVLRTSRAETRSRPSEGTTELKGKKVTRSEFEDTSLTRKNSQPAPPEQQFLSLLRSEARGSALPEKTVAALKNEAKNLGETAKSLLSGLIGGLVRVGKLQSPGGGLDVEETFWQIELEMAKGMIELHRMALLDPRLPVSDEVVRGYFILDHLGWLRGFAYQYQSNPLLPPALWDQFLDVARQMGMRFEEAGLERPEQQEIVKILREEIPPEMHFETKEWTDPARFQEIYRRVESRIQEAVRPRSEVRGEGEIRTPEGPSQRIELTVSAEGTFLVFDFGRTRFRYRGAEARQFNLAALNVEEFQDGRWSLIDRRQYPNYALFIGLSTMTLLGYSNFGKSRVQIDVQYNPEKVTVDAKAVNLDNNKVDDLRQGEISLSNGAVGVFPDTIPEGIRQSQEGVVRGLGLLPLVFNAKTREEKEKYSKIFMSRNQQEIIALFKQAAPPRAEVREDNRGVLEGGAEELRGSSDPFSAGSDFGEESLRDPHPHKGLITDTFPRRNPLKGNDLGLWHPHRDKLLAWFWKLQLRGLQFTQELRRLVRIPEFGFGFQGLKFRDFRLLSFFHVLPPFLTKSLLTLRHISRRNRPNDAPAPVSGHDQEIAAVIGLAVDQIQSFLSFEDVRPVVARLLHFLGIDAVLPQMSNIPSAPFEMSNLQLRPPLRGSIDVDTKDVKPPSRAEVLQKAQRTSARHKARRAEVRGEERKVGVEWSKGQGVVASLAPKGIRSELRRVGIQPVRPEVAAGEVIRMIRMEDGNLRRVALTFGEMVLRAYSRMAASQNLFWGETTLNPEKVKAAPEKVVDTLLQIKSQNVSLGLDIRPGTDELTVRQPLQMLVKILREELGDRKLELIYDAPSRLIDEARKGLDAFPRPHDFTRPIKLLNPQSQVAVIVVGDKLGVSVDGMFLPVQVDLEGETDVLVRDFAEVLKVVVALHLTDLLAGEKTKQSGDVLKAKLLERFVDLSPAFGQVIHFDGQGFTVRALAARRLLLEAETLLAVRHSA